MENRRIEAIMYGKFNNRDNHASLLYANKKGVVLVNQSFKKVLETEIEKIATETEVVLLWQAQIHANYIKTRGGK